jgi:phosphoribosyl 1,2-cyclic phosphate phosphodiesterase
MADTSIELTLLGTGTSAGVPMIGCDCEVCTSTDPRDRRDRAAAMVRYTDEAGQLRTVLIDTAPELRQQMIRHRVYRIDGVVYTHNHADHTFGMDDLRRFNAVMGTAIDIYAEPAVIEGFGQTFRYIFEPHRNVQKSFIASLIAHPIGPGERREIAGRSWLPIRLMHGRLPVLGFRVGNVAYCTDCSSIPPESYAALADLDVLVIDALRYRHHPTHMSVDQALAVIDELKPRRAFLTHIAHDIQHADLEAKLPEGVMLAHDGITILSDA